MMRYFATTFLLLLTCLMLVACGTKNVDESNGEKTASRLTQAEIDQILNDKIAELKTEGDYSEFGDQLEIVKFFGNDVPQILTINNMNSISVVRVHFYDTRWVEIYENRDHNNYDGFENLRIFETPVLNEKSSLQSAIIGLQTGSGGYLNFLVLGNHDNKIVPFVDRMSLDAQVPQGKVYSEGNQIVVESAGAVVERIQVTEPIIASEEDKKTANKREEKAGNEVVDTGLIYERFDSGFYTSENWEQAVDDIAQLDSYQRISFYEELAEELEFTDEEIDQFFYDILEAYETGEYKSSITNDDVRFVGEVLFKSDKIRKHYTTVLNDKNNPKANFAYYLFNYVEFSYDHSREGEFLTAAHNKRVKSLEQAYNNVRKLFKE